MKMSKIRKHKKAVVRVFAIFLATLFFLGTIATVLPTRVDAQDIGYYDDRLIRVGLNYGSGCQNSVEIRSASGFDFGIFDSATCTFSSTSSNPVTKAKITLYQDLIYIVPSDSAGGTSFGTSLWVRASDGGTIMAGDNTYTGILEFKITANGMTLVNIAYLEDYVKGVVVSEVYTKWPAESLKAQAVVARSFTLYTTGKHKNDGFDICCAQHCQAYHGIGNAVEATNAAVDQTRGLVVAYDGKPALTTYHSSSGRTNESAHSAWGSRPEAYPYLSSVSTPFSDNENYVNGKWSYTVSAKELTEYINSKPDYAGILKGEIEKITCKSVGGSSYVNTITVADEFGNEITVNKSTQIRNFLLPYCKSAAFTVSSYCPIVANSNTEYLLDSQNMYIISAEGTSTVASPKNGIEVLTSGGMKTIGTVTDRLFTISGEGYGHGVGMSQYGAMTLAEQGHDFRYILGIYYPGTEIVDVATLAF